MKPDQNEDLFAWFLKNAKSSLFSKSSFTSEQLQYLSTVYLTLLGGILTTATTIFASLFVVSQLVRSICAIFGIVGFLAGTFYFLFPRLHNPDTRSLRNDLIFFFGFAISTGMIYEGLILSSFAIDPSLTLQAIISSVIAFSSLSVASFFASNRANLLVYSAVTSISLGLLLTMGLNLFIGSSVLSSILVLGQSILSILYVLLDSQRMIQNSTHRLLSPIVSENKINF